MPAVQDQLSSSLSYECLSTNGSVPVWYLLHIRKVTLQAYMHRYLLGVDMLYFKSFIVLYLYQLITCYIFFIFLNSIFEP